VADSLRRAAAALVAACACVAAGAQEREQLPIQLTASSLSFDNQKGVVEYGAVTITQGQIRITADRAVTTGVDFEDSKWQFSGTVRISMPDSSIASDSAEVKFSGGEILSAAVTGAPATFEQKREDELARGRANRIDYDMKRGSVELAGNAWLTDGKTEITGETLVYSTASQRVVSQKQVVITIQPGEQAGGVPKPPADAPKPPADPPKPPS
jgi:lipopolysaccharide transport protein LptA